MSHRPLAGLGQTGIVAPILLVSLRIIQGIGGEFGGASSLLAEFGARRPHRSFWISLSNIGLALGLTSGSAVFLFWRSSFAMTLWRIAMLPAVIAVPAFITRYKLSDSPMFECNVSGAARDACEALELMGMVRLPIHSSRIESTGEIQDRRNHHVRTIGIDLGKRTFHLIGLDQHGKVVTKKCLSRSQLIVFTANLRSCLIGMEACCGAHLLGASLAAQGHDVRLIPAQFVKPFVKGNKNDYLDAEAIAEAVQRPAMRFVPIKTNDQLDLQALHRVRDRLVSRRTSVINQLRAFLLERGVTFRKGRAFLKRQMPTILEDAEITYSPRMRYLLHHLWQEWKTVEGQIEDLTEQIQTIARDEPSCQRLQDVPGIGPLATAMVAAVGNGSAFTKGRQFAAWLGLVPKQHSTGGKPKLLGISKRGNEYLRRPFIHGARSVFLNLNREEHHLGSWITELENRKHRNLAVIAVASKIARIA